MANKAVAVVVGAGLGVRFGGNIPKAALQLGGEAVMCMSVRAMAAGGCDYAVLVVNDAVAAELEPQLESLPIPCIMVRGGSTRQESVYKGLRAVKDDARTVDSDVVLIHDAVRPMVPAQVVERVIAAVRDGATAVAPYVPIVDSTRIVDESGQTRPINRDTLRAIQTPQGFPLDAVLAAHEASAGEDFTDDLTCMEAAGHTVELVEGSPLSRKITRRSDFIIAKALWDCRADLGHHDGENA